MNIRVGLQASACAMAFALAACGGGAGSGVGSTPPPPTGSPAPSPSPSPAPSPAPAPTPPPPPTGVNDDLTGILASETFPNDAASGSANYPLTGGGFSADVSDQPMSIVYNADQKTYTVSTAATVQTFSPADVVITDRAQKVYKLVSGQTTDTLTLSQPGTSGLNYKYVGSAFWQRTTENDNSISGSFHALTYGAETPDSAIVRTGGAYYDATLLGAIARPSQLVSIFGEATLGLNLLTGEISGRSAYNGLREIVPETLQYGQTGSWSFVGQLANASNGITGTVTLFDASTDSLSGSATGRLYGPGADELGLAFSATGFDGSQAVGTILGRKNDTSFTATNPSLTDLQFSQTFDLYTRSGLSWSAQSSDGTPAVYSTSYLPADDNYILQYDKSNDSFRLVTLSFPETTVISTAGTADASLSDNKFAGYSSTVASDEETTTQLRIYRFGDANSEVALTYSSFYNLVRIKSSASYHTYSNSWIPFGVYTQPESLPRTGTGNYVGILQGNAIDGDIGDLLATVTGSLTMNVNFASATLDGSINPIITYANGTQRDFGAASLRDGQVTIPGINVQNIAGPPYITAAFGRGSVGDTNSDKRLLGGSLLGYFFGPKGEEITGRFSAEYAPDGEIGFSGKMWGSFATKKDD